MVRPQFSWQSETTRSYAHSDIYFSPEKMTTKMKGLLKGLRYISQIFDNEKEPEMMIGHPTDVKHVAHIGWDGPSLTSPSWMNKFKSSPRHSAPLDAIDKDMFKDDRSNLQATEGSSRGGARSQSCESSPARELPDLPKSMRQHSSTGASSDSPTKANSERVRPPRRSSKSRKDAAADSSKQQPEEGMGDVDSPMRRQLPDVAKTSRRKKSKDSGGGSTRPSSRSKMKASSNEAPYSDPGVSDRIVSISRMEGLEEEEEEKQLRGPTTPDQHI